MVDICHFYYLEIDGGYGLFPLLVKPFTWYFVLVKVSLRLNSVTCTNFY